MTTPDQGNLFPELDGQVSKLDEAINNRRLSLAIDKAMGPGPVYQGVSKAIRRLTATGKYSDLDQVVDPIQHAGTIAAARATARAVDKATGHNPTGWHANGRDLAPLLERLELLMKELQPGVDVDHFGAWLRDESAPREESADARASAQHHDEV